MRVERRSTSHDLTNQHFRGDEIERERDVLQRADADERLNVRIVGCLFEGIHQEDHPMHLAGCDAGGDLQIAANCPR